MSLTYYVVSRVSDSSLTISLKSCITIIYTSIDKLEYFNWIDDQIYSELERNGFIRFNEMLRIINKIRPEGSKKVVRPLLSTHLKKMVKQNILKKDETDKGYKGSYRFTETAKTLRKIKAFEGVKNERDGYNYDETKDHKIVFRKSLRKILYAKGSGITKIVKKTVDKSGNTIVNEIRHDHSFSQQDIIENQAVNSTNIIFSPNVRIKDDDVKDIISVCEKELRITDPTFEDSNFSPTEIHKTGNIIKHYLSICCEISVYVRLILELTWTHIRKYTKAELAWYSETLGQDKLMYFHEYEKKERKNEIKELIQNKADLKREHNKQVKGWISGYDQLIIARKKELDYLLKDMDEKFHPICNLIKDLSYPEFMKDLHAKINQIPKDSTV